MYVVLQMIEGLLLCKLSEYCVQIAIIDKLRVIAMIRTFFETLYACIVNASIRIIQCAQYCQKAGIRGTGFIELLS